MAENVILFPQDYSLDSVLVVTTLGQTLELRHVLQSVSYYEDIYSNSLSGELYINDAVGYLSKYNFSGFEYLTLKFSKPGPQEIKLSKTFRIFKVDQRRMINEQNENYYINFCSEENFLSEQYKISKSYKNKKVSQIVSEIVTKELMVLPEKFLDRNLEQTLNTRDIIIPNLKPFEALNWLCTQAVSANTQYSGSPYLFYENYEGYNFKSLQSLFNSEVYGEYKYEPKNVMSTDDNRVIDLQSAKYTILSYEPVSVFDSLDMTNSGGFANKLITIDPLRQKYDTNYFDYKNYFNKSIHLNDYDLLPNSVNRFGESANNTYDSVTKVVTTSNGQATYNSYIKRFQPENKDTKLDVTIPNRTAQFAHINAHRYRMSIAGDPLMTVGNIVLVQITELEEIDHVGRVPDRFYSGNYLVTAVKHTIDIENKFVTYVEVSKESVPTKYADPDNSLSAWKTIRGR